VVHRGDAELASRDDRYELDALRDSSGGSGGRGRRLREDGRRHSAASLGTLIYGAVGFGVRLTWFSSTEHEVVSNLRPNLMPLMPLSPHLIPLCIYGLR
jgi:hypothetical protein